MRDDPVIVGGLADSGSEAAIAILNACGLELRGPLSAQLDSHWMTVLFRLTRWPAVLLEAQQRPDPELLPAFAVLRAMFGGARLNHGELSILASAAAGSATLGYGDRDGLRGWAPATPFKLVADYLAQPPATVGDGRWGWGHPINQLMLPEIRETFPGMRYVHVVCNPLDAARSENTQGVRLWGRLCGVDPAQVDSSPHNAQLAWWLYCTKTAVAAGRHMGERFMLLRLEQLCRHPVGVARRLAAFAGLAPDDATVREAAAGLSTPPSIGRSNEDGVDGFDPALLAEAMTWIRNWESAEAERQSAPA